METLKCCATCKQQFPLANFSKNKRAADGYHWTCKSCIKTYQQSVKDKLKAYQHDYQKQYKAEHKDELNEYLKDWQKNNREKVRGYVKKSNANRKDKLRAYHQAYRLRLKLEKQQNGE
jgi:hypothetical protein